MKKNYNSKDKEVKSLIFGIYNMKAILKAVNNSKWQIFRKSLKGLSTETKLIQLKNWIRTHNTEQDKIRVTNYVNALKRGGQIKL